MDRLLKMKKKTEFVCPSQSASENTQQPQTTQWLLEALHAENIDHLFMVPGGTIDPIMEEFGNRTHAVTPIIAAHESGAGFMADGYARASGGIGAFACIGGPGATNTLTPLATAFADQSSILAFIGQIQTSVTGIGAFQDGSAAGLQDLSTISPVTRYAQEVPSAELLNQRLGTAIREMSGPNRGPACLMLPVEIQTRYQTTAYEASAITPLKQPQIIDINAATRCVTNMTSAKKILILAGSGAVQPRLNQDGETMYTAADALRQCAELFDIPVATTLKAKGVFPENHGLSLGIFGYAGTPQAHFGLLEGAPDLIIAVGTSLNQRNTMKWDARLSQATIVHVDNTPSAFARNYPADVHVQADATAFFNFLLNLCEEDKERISASQWLRRMWLDSIKRKPRVYEEVANPTLPMHPSFLVNALYQAAPDDTVVLVDSGAHRVFMAHYWESKRPNHYITASATAPMGWAIPAGIGAQLARPEKPHLVVTGDGCMGMHGIEIQTAVRHRIPLVVVVMNNSALGNVYLRTKKMGAGAQEIASLPTHNWAAFAAALGAQGRLVETPESLPQILEEAFLHSGGPFVIDLRCDPDCKTPIGPWSANKSLLHD